MKKHILLTLCVLGTLSLSSCSDNWIEVQSASSLYYSEYMTTESRIFEGLVAAYDPLHWFDYSFGQYTSLNFISDLMGDDVYVGGSDENDCIYLHLMSNYSALPTSVISDLWSVLYSGINRSNLVMENMDKVENISETNKNLYLAEAKVLRAFYYTWLWKMWGNVPYYEVNLSYPYIQPQSTADEVYQGIVVTLEEVLSSNLLPMKAGAGWEGRVTEAMASMLYTDVVLYQNDNTRYDKAASYINRIIESNQYALNPNYADIFETSGEWTNESIFEINYVSQNAGRAWDNAIAAGGSVYPKFIGINGYRGSEFETGWGFEPVRTNAYDAFEANDLRRDATILDLRDTGLYDPRYQDTGLFLRKYLPRIGGNEGQVGAADMNYNNNQRVYRYAEALLYAAELKVRGYGSANAQDCLNQVRQRAGLGTIDATLDNILEERHKELMGEGKRYWDLVRTGQAEQILTAANDPGGYRTVNWTSNKKYLPIPQADIDAAQGTLVQNPY